MRSAPSHRLLTAAALGFIAMLFAGMPLWSGCDEPEIPAGPNISELPQLPERRVVAAPAVGPELPGRELVIALVGEVRGEIEPCGCPTLPYGGFVRRQRALDRLRAQRTVFHLDAGELLLKGLSTLRTSNREARARLVLQLSADVGVDAWVPGPTDIMGVGLAELQRLSRDSTMAVVNASWRDAAGAPLLPMATVVERDGIRLGVVGLSGPPTDRKHEDLVATLAPMDAAREGLALLPNDLDAVVLLGSVTDADADVLARELPGVSLVLTTRGTRLDAPRNPERADGSAGTLVVESPDRGRYLELIYLRLGSDLSAGVSLSPPEQRWRDLDTLRIQVKTLDADAELDPVRVAKAHTDRDAAEIAFAEFGAGKNLARVQSRPLAGDLDGDAAVSPLLAQFKRETVQRAASVAAAPLPPTEPGFASSSACVSCHSQEFARWSYTDHSDAYLSLHERRADKDPECVGCHTTGFAQPGGFGELTSGNLRRFKAVQCEACHGPMRGHPDDKTVHSQPMTAERCVVCHDPANSPQFDFESYIRRASCQPSDGAR